MTNAIRIGLIGDFNPQVKAHIAIPRAVKLAANALGCEAETFWLATPLLEHNTEQLLSDYDALWCVPASPYESMEGALNAIRFAREHGVPFLGTCGGVQHAIIEYARNVLGLTQADHAESNPSATLPLIVPLVCSLVEVQDTIYLKAGTRIAVIYGKSEIVEGYHCSFGLNSHYQSLFEQGEMGITGVDSNGEARAIELLHHPFFVGTLFQPERSAFAEVVHPLIKALLQAATMRVSVPIEERQVRRATLDDARWIVDLSTRVQAALTASGSRQQIGPLPLESVERSIRTGNAYVLEMAEQRLGSVLVDPLESDFSTFVAQWGLDTFPGPLWYLHSLMLEPEEQGKRLGLTFLEEVKRLVVPISGTIILDCWSGNAKLHDFYRRAGFTFHGVFPVKDYEVAVFFFSPLASFS